MSTQSSQSPLSSAKDNGIPVLILLSLHVSVFLIIAGVLLPTEVDMFTSIGGLRMNAELFLFLFAGLYLLWVLAWGFAPSYGRKLGLALSARRAILRPSAGRGLGTRRELAQVRLVHH